MIIVSFGGEFDNWKGGVQRPFAQCSALLSERIGEKIDSTKILVVVFSRIAGRPWRHQESLETFRGDHLAPELDEIADDIVRADSQLLAPPPDPVGAAGYLIEPGLFKIVEILQTLLLGLRLFSDTRALCAE